MSVSKIVLTVLFTFTLSGSVYSQGTLLKTGVGNDRPLLILVGGFLDKSYYNHVQNLSGGISSRKEYFNATIYYMTHTQEKEIASKIRSHKKLYPRAKVIAVGHSFGGEAVIDIRDKVSIDLAVTCDGVKLGVQVGQTKRKKIKKWVNIYPEKNNRHKIPGVWRKESGASENWALPNIAHGDFDAMYRFAEPEILKLIGPPRIVNAVAFIDADTLVYTTYKNELFQVNQFRNESRARHIALGQADNVTSMVFEKPDQLIGTSGNKIFQRQKDQSTKTWRAFGHANDVVALTSNTTHFFAADSKNRLWQRPKNFTESQWKHIGQADNVTGLTIVDNMLIATDDGQTLAQTSWNNFNLDSLWACSQHSGFGLYWETVVCDGLFE